MKETRSRRSSTAVSRENINVISKFMLDYYHQGSVSSTSSPINNYLRLFISPEEMLTMYCRVADSVVKKESLELHDVCPFVYLSVSLSWLNSETLGTSEL
ncbi:hypothetical protein EVAR_50901_1 [Eumeta japonica]|uniref:Uncharacterized protein n=1 Tax=Eumeta variegata TaxID=151549 RepID=A0A4C1YD81_EUMVA|nr:hypothetical protein EVAR_50901_1 [Eumeta japonica]